MAGTVKRLQTQWLRAALRQTDLDPKLRAYYERELSKLQPRRTVAERERELPRP